MSKEVSKEQTKIQNLEKENKELKEKLQNLERKMNLIFSTAYGKDIRF